MKSAWAIAATLMCVVACGDESSSDGGSAGSGGSGASAGSAGSGAVSGGAGTSTGGSAGGGAGGTGATGGASGSGGDFGIIGSTDEEVVTIPCGSTTYKAVLTKSGTAQKWIRYKAQTPKCVTIEGDRTPEDREYWILDGVVIEGGAGSNDSGFFLSADNAALENSEVKGPFDVVTGQPTCTDATPPGTGVWLKDRTFAWIHNVEVHGFKSGIVTGGTKLRVSRSYVHNNHNGISSAGKDVYIHRNVLWMNPNHGVMVEDNAADVASHYVYFAENLIVDTQESLFMYGGAKYEFVNNTWWGGGPCGLGVGLMVLDRAQYGNKNPQGPLFFYDNFLGGTSDANRFIRFEVDIKSVMGDSDYNRLYRPEGKRTEWAKDTPSDTSFPLATWQSQFGFDNNSATDAKDPGFTNPNITPVPKTYEEARERFRPKKGGPLCGAGRAGTTIGAIPCP